MPLSIGIFVSEAASRKQRRCFQVGNLLPITMSVVMVVAPILQHHESNAFRTLFLLRLAVHLTLRPPVAPLEALDFCTAWCSHPM